MESQSYGPHRSSERPNPYQDLTIPEPSDADEPPRGEKHEPEPVLEVPEDLVDVPANDAYSPTDAEQLKAMAADLSEARQDSLTGLLNQSGLDSALTKRFGVSIDRPRFLDASVATQPRRVVILYGDVCDMKVTNDAYGHAKGDEAIGRVARRFASVFRGQDIVARPHGDELVAIVEIPEVYTDEEAQEFADSLTERARQTASVKPQNQVPGQPEQVVAIGVALGEIRPLTDEERAAAGPDAPASTVQSLLHEADQEMYAHKVALADKGIISPRSTTEVPPQMQQPDMAARVRKATAYYSYWGSSDEPPLSDTV